MRRVLLSMILAALGTGTSAAHADPCGDLVDKVAAATQARVGERSLDYAHFTAGSDTTLTLSCGDPHPSSVGAQFRGEAPPDGYYTVFGRAGQAVTGIAADVLESAAQRARADAARLRHSNIAVGGALVTCSLTRSDRGALTMCAVIEQGDRS